jgi:hypothetical protein
VTAVFSGVAFQYESLLQKHTSLHHGVPNADDSLLAFLSYLLKMLLSLDHCKLFMPAGISCCCQSTPACGTLDMHFLFTLALNTPLIALHFHCLQV